MTHYRTIKMFPQEFILLNKEIANHPELQRLLSNHETRKGENEIEIKLAEIAKYCNVILDGTYDEESLTKLARILEQRLYLLRPRSEIIILN